MKSYSVVLLDIDGTLVDSSLQISGNTKKLLKRIEKRGIPVVLCSARSPSGVNLIEQDVGLSSPVVCFGGGLILDQNGSFLADSGIDRDTALRFRQYAALEFPAITVSTYMYDIWLVDSLADPEIQKLMERNPTSAALEGDLASAVQTVSHVHKLLCAGPPLEIRRLQLSAQEKFSNVTFARSGSIYLEVFGAETSKLNAMRCIQKHCGVSLDQIVAIGDYYVDIEMIRAAGLGIAMGNAPDEVKEAADRVTTSCDEEGVYIALKSLRFTPPFQTADSQAEKEDPEFPEPFRS